MEKPSKLRTASWNVRTAARNLWINAVVCLVILGLFYMADFFKITTMTPEIEQYVHWAVVAIVIAWVLFLFHWFGELALALWKGNYHFLWSFLPFLLPLITFLARSTILGWICWPFD